MRRIFVDGKEVVLPVYRKYGLGPLRLLFEKECADAYNRVIYAQVIAKTAFERMHGYPWQHSSDFRPYLCVRPEDEQKFREAKTFIEEACWMHNEPPIDSSLLEDLILIPVDELGKAF